MSYKPQLPPNIEEVRPPQHSLLDNLAAQLREAKERDGALGKVALRCQCGAQRDITTISQAFEFMAYHGPPHPIWDHESEP